MMEMFSRTKLSHRTRHGLKLIYYSTYFSTVIPSKICVFLSVGLSLLIHFQQVFLVGVEISYVSWLGELTIEV